MKRRRWLSAMVVLCVTVFVPSSISAGSVRFEVPTSFIQLAQSKALAKPGLIVIDPTTHETVYASRPDSLRAPASILKLLSTFAALQKMDSQIRFATDIYTEIDERGVENGSFIIEGANDPWLTLSQFEADKYHRAFLPYIFNKLIAENPTTTSFTIDYYGIYATDLVKIRKYFGNRVSFSFHQISNAQEAQSKLGRKIAGVLSPPLSDIVEFTLLWSDNVLADRLARITAGMSGLPKNQEGLQMLIEQSLDSIGVEHQGLHIVDGNGLSKSNQVSARTIADLLVKIREDERYSPIYLGLPLAGKTGTLKTRFTTDAPSAVGLVKAKTGWINGTVSLAGYVTVRDKQYVFAVIADKIKPRESYRQQARITIDKMLATIARPAS